MMLMCIMRCERGNCGSLESIYIFCSERKSESGEFRGCQPAPLPPPSSYTQTNKRTNASKTGALSSKTISFYFHVRDAKKRSKEKMEVKTYLKITIKYQSEASAFFVVVEEQSL
jgi:hypothetical protein